MHRIVFPVFVRGFSEVKIVNLEQLPVRRISFTTQEDERKKLFQKAKNLYHKELEKLTS